ncbi:LamG-like jellyroll fold domain-containing protein [Chryseobacterium sp.]|uniref:LamG domain-containing protein n=1 Tax=Chryseobacterium sp. TaxID=1871047 RepID=UPI0028965441|nr:LamG-like jellyroll fold domain-containing protein [Chryseobacterium sp.]
MKKILLLSSVLFSLFAKAQTPAYVPSSGLVAWWDFSGNANDSSPNANHLTVSGATLTTDRNGTANSAYSFNGTNAYLTKSSLSYNFSQSGSYSVSFWMKKTGNSEGVAMMSGSNTGGNFIWLLQCDTTKTIFGTNKQGESWTWANGPNYSTTAWEHFVAVYNNLSMQLYKNGSLVSSANNTNTTSTSASLPFSIGRAIGGGYIAASIDDVGIWNRALSAAEINQLYTGNLSTSDIKNSKLNLSIAPNPVNDLLYVNIPVKGINTYTITDINGRKILNGEMNDSKTINVSSLTKGAYFILIEGIGNLKFLKK